MKVSIMRHMRYQCLALSVVLAVIGCSSLQPSNIATFSTGVTTARSQASLAFQEVTDLTSEAIIDYAAKQPTLTQANFFAVLDPTAVAAWDRVFSALEKYGHGLMTLTSPDITKDYKDAAVQLAQDIQSTGEKLKEDKLISTAPAVPATLATAFTKLGDVLLRAKANADARLIMTEADPFVRQIFVTMGDVVGPSTQGGLRGTVFAHWEQEKAKRQAEFLNTQNPAERRSLAVEFARLMNQQQTQDLALASLRRSFLALADAHYALAQGHDVTAATAVSIVIDEIKDTKALYERFKSLSKNGQK